MKKLMLATTAAAMLLTTTTSFAHDEDVMDNDMKTPVLSSKPATMDDSGPGTADPNASPKAAPVISVPKKTLYTPPNGTKQMTFGQMVARHLHNANVSDFKTALEKADIGNDYDTTKGYTVFAPVNGKFDAAKHPVDHYIVNGHVDLTSMGANAKIASMHGDKLSLGRVSKSYFVDSLRVNKVDRFSDGAVYTIGGASDAFSL